MPKYFQEEFDTSISLAKLIDQNWSNFLLPEEITSEFSSSWEKETGYPCQNSGGVSRLSTSDSKHEGVPHTDLAKAICTYPLFGKLMGLQSLAKFTVERAGINTFKDDFQKQFYNGKTRDGEPVKNWDKIRRQIDDDFGGEERGEILKKFFTDSDSFHGIKGIGREHFTSSALCEAAGGKRKDSFYYVHQVASATNDSIYEKTKAYIEGFAASASPEEEIKPYDLNDLLTHLFIDESEVQSIKDSLGTKKNVVLQGPPGVGKTFVAQRLAYYLIGQKKKANIGMVQFHQSYSYEDFIQGYRPTEEHFELKDGVFYRFCEEARERPDEKFVFIIDEINRGNLSKIFGEIMMLIEADKREEKYAVKLTYAKNETDPFFVPENVHLLGLMNTADRSLAIVDYALRRRFRFFDIKPSFGESFKKHLSSKGVSNELIDKICSKIETLNNFIREDHRNLGEGFMIGHSYFCDPPLSAEDHNKWLSDIFNYEIVPLINEYWIDNKEVKEKRTSDLLEGLS